MSNCFVTIGMGGTSGGCTALGGCTTLGEQAYSSAAQQKITPVLQKVDKLPIDAKVEIISANQNRSAYFLFLL